MSEINIKPLKVVKKKSNFVKHKYSGPSSGSSTVLKDISINKNGTFYAETGTAYNVINVNVTDFKLPELTLSILPSKTLYNKSTETLSSLEIIAKVIKGTNNISLINFFVDNVLVHSEATYRYGGEIKYTHTFSPAINSNCEIRVDVYDEENKKVSKDIGVAFNYPSYYGIIPADTESITEEILSSLTSEVKTDSKLDVNNISTDYGKIIYLYPATFDTLESIYDPASNFNYTDSFSVYTTSINDTQYLCYLLTDAAAMDNMQLSFR